MAQESASAPTCRLVRSAGTFDGKQGFTYQAGVSAQTTEARGICMHLLTVPPGGRAKAHLHESHETAIYMISGEIHTWYGEGLREHVVARAGDFLYIPPGCPHLPINLGDQPSTCLIARTDANEQESVVLLPELDAVVDQQLVAA